MELQIIGGGRMGEALVSGLLSASWAEATELAVIEADEARADDLRERLGDVTVGDVPVRAAGAVLAVKPNDMADACAALARRRCRRVLSIAAGVTITRLEDALGPKTAVVRAMPNTPALVGHGASAIAAGSTATDDDLEWAESILNAVGTVVRVKEPLLDAVTGLSGSGPAYVFLMLESLIEGGVLAGLPRDQAQALATQTLVGSAQLLVETGDDPETLRAAVTSPAGTTAAGLRALERGGARAAFLEAVVAATERSKELGQP